MADDMSPGEDSARVGEPRVPATMREALAAAAQLAPDGRGRLHASSLLQSWPGMVHGGGVVALLDAAAGALAGGPMPRLLEGRLTATVPTETSLDLDGYVDEQVVRLTILRGGQILGSGAISGLEAAPAATGTFWRGGDDGSPLPLSEHCLACGRDNPLGLQAELRFDDTGVWARLSPRAPWRAPDGGWHLAVAPVLLDEIAWWLGALVMKEGGLTNRFRVMLLRPDALFAGPLVGAGRFDAVTPVDRKRIFWRTETALLTADGVPVATASIVFRGGADYSARQMEYFRRRTPRAVFRRMFPAYAS